LGEDTIEEWDIGLAAFTASAGREGMQAKPAEARSELTSITAQSLRQANAGLGKDGHDESRRPCRSKAGQATMGACSSLVKSFSHLPPTPLG
jgi:hypothetical protein